MPGTFSSGISTPRSPRATMIASVTSMMSSSRVTAAGFSILAITAARPRQIFFASAMSSGRWMNDSPTQSMPASSAASRSERSFGVRAENGIKVSGRLTPLRSDSLPPTSTLVTIFSRLASVTTSLILPSSSSSRWPASMPAKISGCGNCTRSASPGLASWSNAKIAPLSSIAGPLAKAPTRSFGPCRSHRMPIGRAYFASTARIAATSSRMRSCEEWLMLMRNVSAPASNSLPIISGLPEAGPSVATILVLRRRLIGAGFRAVATDLAVRAWAAGPA